MLLFIDVSIIDILDILLVAVIIFQVYYLIRGTVAIRIFVGILAIYLMWKLVTALQMEMLGEILGQFIGVGVIALLIVFQQELRQFLLFIGNTDVIKRDPTGILSKFIEKDGAQNTAHISPIVKACTRMALSKTGALIVVSGKSDPEHFMSSKEKIDAKVTQGLIESIFYKNSPLHDGAVVVRDGRISSVRGVLPVSENPDLKLAMGMRHRAALGISEVSDASTIIVSEQTGKIAFAKDGVIQDDVSPEQLATLLGQVSVPQEI
jgi:diadenylate cyclase